MTRYGVYEIMYISLAVTYIYISLLKCREVLYRNEYELWFC